MQWQTALREYGYKGRIDGIPGKMTYRAIQSWAGVTADGILGPATRKAVQGKIGVKQDGVWGKLTISALQRKLNEGKI
jgi:peptidoglycan hydrolase-like protein with peptidoglycan-binding domain